jgi:tripartite-type tricarboxylate transporter receptor subunit TctC
LVEDKPGAGSTLGTAAVAAAKPDGYTLLATATPVFSISHLLYKTAQYDPVTSFTPIGMFARGSPFLVVNPSVPAKTLAEFVALAKAAPGTVSLAHSGLAGMSHLPAELFRQAAGIEFLYVPYKGEAPALQDLLGGQVSASFIYLALGVPQIRAAKIRPLAYAGAQRNSALPDVPTVAELGYPGFEFHGSMVLLGPAGLSKEIVGVLNREIALIMQEPAVRAAYASGGADPVSGSPEEVAALIKRDIAVSGTLVRRLGISLE